MEEAIHDREGRRQKLARHDAEEGKRFPEPDEARKTEHAEPDGFGTRELAVHHLAGFASAWFQESVRASPSASKPVVSQPQSPTASMPTRIMPG